MNIYKVYVDNGLDYEDINEVMYIIGTNNSVEAEKIGMEYFNRQYWNTGKNSTTVLITHTDNGYQINLKNKNE